MAGSSLVRIVALQESITSTIVVAICEKEEKKAAS
jgi:hypothetical protein